MTRPTIASITAERDRAVERAAREGAATVGTRRDLEAARAELDEANARMSGLEIRLGEAELRAAYWLGRVHQSDGIPEDDLGRPIADLVRYLTGRRR